MIRSNSDRYNTHHIVPFQHLYFIPTSRALSIFYASRPTIRKQLLLDALAHPCAKQLLHPSPGEKGVPPTEIHRTNDVLTPKHPQAFLW
jgi:hypothetical protein